MLILNIENIYTRDYSSLELSKTTMTFSTIFKSSKNGTKTINSVSLGSLNQDPIGIAFVGWNMYEAGELSIMITSFNSLPSRLRS